MKLISTRALNTRVVKYGKAQRDKNDITCCAIAASNFLCVISCYRSLLRSYNKKTAKNYYC